MIDKSSAVKIGSLSIFLFAFLFSIFFLLPLGEAQQSETSPNVTYTRTTRTVCRNGQCTLTLYPRTRFVRENGNWTKIENAKNLRPYFEKVYIEKDTKWDINITQLNYTHVEGKLIAETGTLPTGLPFNAWKCLQRNVSTGKCIKKMAKNMTVGTPKKVVNFSMDLQNPTGFKYKLGYGSTTIQLQEANTELLDDVNVDDDWPDTNYDGDYTYVYQNIQRTLLKFNISAVPSGMNIDSSTLSLLKEQSLEGTFPADYKVHHVSDDTWTEETVTASNEPSHDATADDTTSVTDTTGVRFTWDVTSMVSDEYSAGNVKVSMKIIDTTGGKSSFGSKERGSSGYLNVTYSSPNQPPTYSNFNVESPPTYDPNVKTNISIDWSDPNGNFDNSILETNITGSPVNQTNNVTSYSAVLGAGGYYAKFYGNDTQGAWNSTSKNTFSISKASPGLSVSKNVTSPITYPTPSKTTGSGCPSQLTCSLYRNDSSVTRPDEVLLGAGGYGWQWNTSGNENYTSEEQTTTLTVNKGTPSLSLSINTTWTETYPTPTKVTASESNQGDTDVSYNFYRNDTGSITSPDEAEFGAGAYKYIYNNTVGANWTSTSTSNTLTINKGTPSGSLTMSPVWTVTYPTTTTAGYSETNQGDNDLTYKIFRNGTDVGSETVELSAHTWSYKLNTTGGNNWTSVASMDANNLVVEKGGVNIDLYFSNKTSTVKNQNITVWPSTEFNATAVINITKAGQDTFSLYQDGVSKGTQTDDTIEYLTHLSPGQHYFNASYPGNENYTSFTRDPYVESIQWIDWIKTYKDGTETSKFLAGDTATIKTSVTVPDNIKTDLDTVNTSLKNPQGTVMLDNLSTFKFYDYFNNDNFWDVIPGTASGFGGSSSSWSITADDWYQYSNSTEYKGISVENETGYYNTTITAKAEITSSTEGTIRIVFRYKDKDSWSSFYASEYYSVIGIEDYVNGTRHVSETSKTISLNTVHDLKVVVEGDTATGYFNGFSISKDLNDTRDVPGKVGLSADACTVKFDNFTVTSPDTTLDVSNTTHFVMSTDYKIPQTQSSDGTWDAKEYTINFDGDFSYNSTSFDASYSAPVVQSMTTYNYLYEKTSDFQTGQKVIIRANVTDPQNKTDLDTVLFNLTNPTGSKKVTNYDMANVTSIDNSGYVYEYNYTVPTEDKSYGTWDMDFYANDTSGNSTTDSSTFDVSKLWIMTYKNVNYTQWFDTQQGDNVTYIKSVKASDLDGDGTKEITDFGRSHHGTGTNHFMFQMWNTSRSNLHDLKLNKEMEKYWYLRNHSFGYSHDPYYNLDDDPAKEIVLGGVAYNGTYNFAYLAVANITDNTLYIEDNATWITGGGDTEIYRVKVWNRSGGKKITFTGTARSATDPIFTYIYNYTDHELMYEDSNFWSLGYKGEGYDIDFCDLDEDNTEEMITGGIVDNGQTAVEGGDLYEGFIQIFNYTNENLKVENRTHYYKNDITEIFSLSCGDADSDSHPELVTSGNWFDGSRDRAHLKVWNYTQPTLTLQDQDNWYIEGHASFTSNLLENMDNDESLEIVAVGFQDDGVRDRGKRQIFQYNSTTGTFVTEEERLWKEPQPIRDGDFSDAIAVADLNDDGIKELVGGGRYRMSPPSGTFLRVDSFIYPTPQYGNIVDNSPISGGQAGDFSVQWKDEEGDLDTAILEFNGTNYTVSNETSKHTVGFVWHNYSISDLSKGNYTYKWYANGSYWNSTPVQTFNVTGFKDWNTSTVAISSYDLKVLVGNNLSAFYNVSVGNNGTTNLQNEIVNVTDLIDHSTWMNTSSENLNVTIDVGGVKYYRVNITNVTVRETFQELNRIELSNYVKHVYNSTLTVYEPNLTPDLPIHYNISVSDLSGWGGRDSSLTFNEIDQKSAGLTRNEYADNVTLIISTSFSNSSLEEGSHNFRMGYYREIVQQGGGGGGMGWFNRTEPTVTEYQIKFKVDPEGIYCEIVKDRFLVKNLTLYTGSTVTLNPGDYRFKCYRSGYKLKEFTKTVESDDVLSIDLKKEEEEGEGKVREVPSGEKLGQTQGGVNFTTWFLILGVVSLAVYLLLPEGKLKVI
ncbi:hypothetical protein AKJ58_00120 [candidate division MSBL1 archaeon SCGC-AAA385D11]|uniref:Carbohydrate-binding module family 96 domain-containing protein n=1 Tax=candidate division MSBL1 archaeon SCGC-AAA385D11 TaxID=1698286 RepID=A0A133VPJ0_9EURY|nr:hypothetical protein AKJ58_00120 [candidate division MSBL1 archaeon SCGC-AAA385D11]